MVEKGKTKTENIAGILIRYVLLAVIVALGTLLCFRGVRGFVGQKVAQSQIQVIRSAAHQNRLRAQAAFDQAENAAVNWAGLIPDEYYTYISELQEAVAQGNALLGTEQLSVTDEDGLFYGADGSIGRREELKSLTDAMSSDREVFYSGGKLLICIRLKPFTVEGERFSLAVAEYAPESVFGPSLILDSAQSGCILNSNGSTVAQSSGRGLFDTLKNARLEGYLSGPDVKKAIPGQQRLEVNCTLSGQKLLLVSEKLEGRDFYYLTLSALEDASPTPRGIVVLPLLLVLLMAAGFGLAGFFLLALRQQRRRTKAVRKQKQALEEELEAARQLSDQQLEHQKQISRDIRTPLNVIVGYTTLANRHLQEPELVGRYLEKITESSKQLLARSDEGLEKARTIEQPQPETVEKFVNLEGKRVLLVEDNRLNREIAADILGECGILVETAGNGQEGFQKLSLSQPGYYNLVLMDIQMPVMDGYEATRTIRRLRSKMLAEIPIIAMTAGVADEDKKKAFQAGMDGYVEKPIDIGKLLRAIQTALKQSYSG